MIFMLKKFLENKKIFWVIVVVVMAFLVVGGTYAYLTATVGVNNGNYNYAVECFMIDYDITNDGVMNSGSDETTNIEGTLFQSMAPVGGLTGKVSLKLKDECTVTGIGTLYIHVGNEVSPGLVKTVSSHCEDNKVLQTQKDYTSESACTSVFGNRWVSDGSALKYAVYASGDLTEPLSVGYINTDSIGTDLEIYTGFDVDHTQLSFDVYIWLDGYLADNSYISLPFSGYIHALVMQQE